MEELRERNKRLEEDLALRTTPWRERLDEIDLERIDQYRGFAETVPHSVADIVTKLTDLLDDLQGINDIDWTVTCEAGA